ncbi:MAG TPA: hypothetical protein VN930_05720 [Xanthobacteraceae bacterium]|nr:hypothetical protein [Xanthobacteraceae bacterium]
MTLLDPADAPIGPATVELGPWQRRLANFHRIAGGFMILKGLLHWGTLFGLDGTDFFKEAVEAQSSVVFFAIVDLAAGVALWLGSPWGASLWFMTVAAQLIADVAYIEHSAVMVLLSIVEILLVAVYVLLRFRAHSEKHSR